MMDISKALFHPFFVHFPIALCFFEFFLLSAAGLKKNKEYLPFARLTFQALAVCLVLTLVTGYRDAGASVADLFEDGVRPHFYSACVFTALVFARLLLWKRFHPGHSQSLAVQFAGSVLVIAAVMVTAYWGGELVYG